MLATEFDNSKKKLNDTDVDFLSISWSSCLIRFSEKLQIIDVQDCMNVMYETHGSAKSAQSKYFSADLANTERVLECEAGKLLLKVKWKDAARNRLAISVQFMQKFCEKICKMARASNLASKLDVEVLTVRNLCQEYVAENTGDNGCRPLPELTRFYDEHAREREAGSQYPLRDLRLSMEYMGMAVPTSFAVRDPGS